MPRSTWTTRIRVPTQPTIRGLRSWRTRADNPIEEELAASLGSLNDDELTKLLALLWVGRGDYDRSSWLEALRQAREAKNKRIVRYLIGTPMLGELLEEGLAEMGVTVPLAQEDRVG